MDEDSRAARRAPMAEIEAVRDALRLYGHDIRAAMSEVIGGLRLIDTDMLPPDTQTRIDRVRVASETLAELIDGATTVSSSGTLKNATAASFDFRSFLAGIELRWAGRAREQGLEFQMTVDRHVPERIHVARLNLDRILGNLVANALKFTDNGKVTLRIAQSDGDLTFQIKDQGIGFSEPALERLFTTSGRPHDAKRPGHGLGLHISKGLADGLGGTLSVWNCPEGGACARLSLPRDSWACREQPADLPNLSDLTLLVAEDNETNRLLVGQMLTAMDAKALFARDGQEALDMLMRHKVDIALLDIEMPRLSGIDVMRHLRADPGFSTPLVALTAYVMRENREAIFAAGADGVIAKPIRSTTAFGQAIRRHVNRLSLDPEVPPPSPSHGDSFDPNRFEAILQAAGPDGRGELLDHLRHDLRSVRAALATATDSNDTALTRAQSHILISLAGAVGADRLQIMAESLNAAAHRNRLADALTLVQSCDEALADLIELVERRADREEML